MARTAMLKRTFSLGRRFPTFVAALDNRLVVIEDVRRRTSIEALVLSFAGDIVGRPRVPVHVSAGVRHGRELIVAGQGDAASIDVDTLRVTCWKIAPSWVGALGRTANVLAAASYARDPDVVHWFDLRETPPRRVSRLATDRKRGWSRCPYVLVPSDDARWWLASERRLALVDASAPAARVERSIELEFAASQILFTKDHAFCLEVVGGYWQWRDGELRVATSFVTGGSPPQPGEVLDDARLFRVDLAAGGVDAASPVPAGMLIPDAEGVAIARPGCIVRLDQVGKPREVLRLPVPESESMLVTPMPYNRSSVYQLRCPGPGQLFSPSYGASTHEVLQFTWGPGTAQL